MILTQIAIVLIGIACVLNGAAIILILRRLRRLEDSNDYLRSVVFR